jgi:hypothetical protein
MVQGYFIAPPLPPDVAEGLLDRTDGTSNHLDKILGDRLRGSGEPDPDKAQVSKKRA